LTKLKKENNLIVEKEKTLKEEVSVFWNNQKKENDKELYSTNKLEGKCPTCKQELGIKQQRKTTKRT